MNPSRHPTSAGLRIVGIGLGVALLAFPMGVVLTLALVPFWSWLEATTGIEAIGHSGPADWCYMATTALVFGGIAVPLWRMTRGVEAKVR